MPAKQLQSLKAYCTKASLKVRNFEDKDMTCAFSFARSQSWKSSIQQHFANFLRKLAQQSSKALFQTSRIDGAALGENPIHCTLQVTMSVNSTIRPWDLWWSEHHFFCSCGTSFVIIIIDIHQEQPGSLVGSSGFLCYFSYKKSMFRSALSIG